MPKAILVFICWATVGTAVAAENILFDWDKGEAENYWGMTIVALGDINGDGASDVTLIVGEEIDIFFGGPDADANADLVIAPPNGPHPGFPLEGPIDLNGDGQSDLIIAANGATSEGPIYCYWGGSSLDDIADFVIHGSCTASGACRAGNFMPDDAIDDLAVSKEESNYGYVDVYEGGTPPAEEKSWRRIEYVPFTGWAHSFHYAGDFDGDGYGDIATGAPWATSSCKSYGLPSQCSRGGQLYIYHGGPNRLHAAAVVNGDEAEKNLGYEMAANFDTNADGYSDLLATKYGSDETWVIYGRPSFPFTINGPNLILPGGKSTAALGDINGDGADDLATVDSSGLLRIFLGGAALDAKPDGFLTLPPEDTRDLVRVFRVYDFNEDGFDDIGVGIREEVSSAHWITSFRIYSGPDGIVVPTEQRTTGGLKSLFRAGAARGGKRR